MFGVRTAWGDAGLKCFVYAAKRGFHGERLWRVATSNISHLRAVVRAKGYLWLATRPDRWGLWSQVADNFQFSGIARLAVISLHMDMFTYISIKNSFVPTMQVAIPGIVKKGVQSRPSE